MGFAAGDLETVLGARQLRVCCLDGKLIVEWIDLGQEVIAPEVASRLQQRRLPDDNSRDLRNEIDLDCRSHAALGRRR